VSGLTESQGSVEFSHSENLSGLAFLRALVGFLIVTVSMTLSSVLSSIYMTVITVYTKDTSSLTHDW